MGSAWPDLHNLMDITLESGVRPVRASLAAVRDCLAVAGVQGEDLSTIELVLAEVLNNVVEHAYADASGPIRLAVATDGARLRFLIEDQGSEMPGGRLPIGILPDPDPENLPEGGFGWFLIRQLCETLDYTRQNGWNQIRLSLMAGQSAHN